ncbi:MAG TPA: hypothetical protein VEK56_05925 [Vicinamibacterales bacterium]|nr:hypothetical protein [Vicinamibacterales bacterium]
MKRPAVLIAITCAVARVAAAQDPGPAPQPHHISASAGVAWLVGHSLGGSTAALRRNEPGTATPGPSTLFRADTSIEQSAGVEARLAYALTRALEVEVGGAHARPRLAVQITQDVESRPVALRDATFSQYIVDVSALWQVNALELGSHARPYVIAGGGRVWQLYEDRAKLVTGALVQFGGGVRYWLRGGKSRTHPAGVRGEVRLQVYSAGLDIPDRTRIYPCISVFGFFGF